MTTIQPLAVLPDEGEVFDVGPFHIVTRLTGDQTGGVLEVYDLTLTTGSVDYHVHNTMDETLAVIEGEVEFQIAGEFYTRRAGSVTFAPRGVHHGFVNHGPNPARVLIAFTPSGSQDDYFRQLVGLFQDGAPDPEQLAALQAKYDQSLIVGV